MKEIIHRTERVDKIYKNHLDMSYCPIIRGCCKGLECVFARAEKKTEHVETVATYSNNKEVHERDVEVFIRCMAIDFLEVKVYGKLKETEYKNFINNERKEVKKN